jgi:hypothetical protein
MFLLHLAYFIGITSPTTTGQDMFFHSIETDLPTSTYQTLNDGLLFKPWHGSAAQATYKNATATAATAARGNPAWTFMPAPLTDVLVVVATTVDAVVVAV